MKSAASGDLVQRLFLSDRSFFSKHLQYAASILASREAPVDRTALSIQSRPFIAYELSFGTSFAKVGRLGAENNYCK